MSARAAAAPKCASPLGDVPGDRNAIERIENVYRAWCEAHATIPEMEVHSTPELTWMCGPGVAWSSVAVRVRLPAAAADARLRAAFARAFSRGRGFGLWTSDLAQPADLDARLTRIRFRKRKRFPGMLADLTKLPATAPGAVEVHEVADTTLFNRHPHPYFGRISTHIKRVEMRRVAHLAALHPHRVFHLVAARRLSRGRRIAYWYSKGTKAC